MRVTDFNPRPTRYRVVEDGCDGEKKLRVRVVLYLGFEGYVIRWTDGCSGCLERGDYGTIHYSGGYDQKLKCEIGGGCEECGHTGKRRNSCFIAFDGDAFRAYQDERWARGQRLLRYFERLAAERPEIARAG